MVIKTIAHTATKHTKPEPRMVLHVSGRGDRVGGLGERIFFSKDISHIGGISLRQLQWWDERKLVSPRQQEHRRVYSVQQVLEILTVVTLRQKGISLQNVRLMMRRLRRQLPQRLDDNVTPSTLYLLTDGRSVYLEEQPKRILSRLSAARTGMYVVCLSDLIRLMTSKQVPRRYRTQQLQLF